MQKYVSVRSTVEVKPLEINEYYVIVNKGIKEVHEAPENEEMAGGFDGWEIEEQTMYEKDEYIGVITAQNAELEATVNSILTDVIPSMMV